MSGSFTGKVAIVTGASSGIGEATAVALARQGAAVTLVARRRERLEQLAVRLADQAQGQAPDALVVAGDVTDPVVRAQVVQATVQAHGGVDVLVNAAGIISTGTVENTSLDAWQQMFDVNVTATFHLMQLATEHLIERNGSIVNVSSVTGLRSFPGILSYCTSKAAVDQLTRCAALELADRGVRVNAVNPGVVVSGLHREGGMDDAAYAAFLEHSKTTHPMGRVGQAEEVADLICFLASDASGWMTGATLPIDGGRHLTCAR